MPQVTKSSAPNTMRSGFGRRNADPDPSRRSGIIWGSASIGGIKAAVLWLTRAIVPLEGCDCPLLSDPVTLDVPRDNKLVRPSALFVVDSDGCSDMAHSPWFAKCCVTKSDTDGRSYRLYDGMNGCPRRWMDRAAGHQFDCGPCAWCRQNAVRACGLRADDLSA